MLFCSKPNVKSICHKIGIGGICITQGFASVPRESGKEGGKSLPLLCKGNRELAKTTSAQV